MNMMVRPCRSVIVPLVLMLAVLGCSGSGTPSVPSVNPADSPGIDLTAQAAPLQPSTPVHYLWFFNLLYVDASNPANPVFETIPVREAANHWNVLQWLEKAPCTDCLEIAKIVQSGTGTLLVDVRIKHPFPNPNLTGFDVRGIAMFNASHVFPASGLTWSYGALGDGELMNADGYTTLYNASTLGHDFEGYFKGKLSTATTPNAMLNGYKRYITSKPENTRNAFYAGDSITVTNEIHMPDKPFVFGYAVDASWVPATHKPVTDPMQDFPLSANCPEAWRIDVMQTSVGDGLTDCTGSTVLNIDVYDWQGKDDAHPVLVECPELFDGTVQAGWKEDFTDHTRYEAVVENPKNELPGAYKCLIGKEANEDDPAGKPWLGLTAYQVVTLVVNPHGILPLTPIVETSQSSAYMGEEIQFDGSKSLGSDCHEQTIVQWLWDWENDGVFEDEGEVVSHSWSWPGIHYVVLKVVDDKGDSALLSPPLQFLVTGNPKAPYAEADYDVFTAYVTHPVHFYDEGSSDPDGGSIINYEWDWDNDGAFDEAGKSVYHTWDTPGTYYVQFRVTDSDDGLTGVLYQPLEVNIKPLTPPDANADVYPNPGFLDQQIHFYDYGSYDPDGGALVKHEWDWDNDGVFDEVGSDTHHSWSAPGIYPVQFRVTDDEGATGVLSKPLEVTVNPSNPLNIQDITPPSLNFSPKDVAIDGNYAYVAASGNGLHIFDITDPTSPVWVNRVETGNGLISDSSGDDATAVAVQNGYAYVADWQSGLTIVDVDPPQSAAVVKNVPTNGYANAVALYSGYALAITHSYYDQLVIIDVDPVDEAHVVKTIDAPGAQKVFIDGNYAYTDGNNILKTDITAPDNAQVVSEMPVGGYGIAVAGGYAYTTEYHSNVEYSWYTLAVVDIDPPESAYIVNELDGGIGIDMQISGNDLFLSSTSQYYAYDISSPEAAYKLDSYQAGWSLFGGFGLQGGYAYLANRVQGLEVLKINPASNISLEKRLYTPGGAKDVSVSGGYAFISNVYTGLQIYGVDPPSSAAFVNAVQKNVYAGRIEADNGYAFMGQNNGTITYLEAYDVDPPASAFAAKQINAKPNGNPFVVKNGYAYISVSGAFNVIDVDPIDSASVVGSIAMNAGGIALDGDYAYVASGSNGLSIVDISTPDSPSIVKTIPGSGSAGLVDVENGYAYVGRPSSSGAVDIFDIDPIDSAYFVKTVTLPSKPADLAVSNGYVFMAAGCGIAVVDATSPENAYLLTEYPTPYALNSVDIVGNVAYFTGTRPGDSGLLMYQLW